MRTEIAVIAICLLSQLTGCSSNNAPIQSTVSPSPKGPVQSKPVSAPKPGGPASKAVFRQPSPRSQSALPTRETPQRAKLPSSVAKVGDAAIRRAMIRASIASYAGNCPCPYSTTRRGRRCGGRSAWSRPGGASPYCFPTDISDGLVARYRQQR